MGNKINICMVIGLFKPFVGGAEKQAELLGKTLLKNNVDVSLITSLQSGVVVDCNQDSFPVKRIGLPGLGKISDFIFAVTIFVKLLLDRKRVDIIHVHQALLPSFASVAAAKLLKKPVLIKCSNSGPRFDLDYFAQTVILGKYMAKFLAKNTDIFVAINEEVGLQLKTWGVEKKRIVYIPNGVFIEHWKISENELFSQLKVKSENKQINLITVCSLSSKKDLGTLIQALEILKMEIPFKLFMLGKGPLREQLEMQVKNSGLEKYVTFVGKVDSSVVQQYLRDSDIFILPSITEGVSNALLEAMAAGVLCIASDIPGNRKVITHLDNGLLFKVGDIDALSDSIRTLSIDTGISKKTALSAQKRIQDFEIGTISRHYLKVYDDLLKKHNKS